MAVAHVSKSTGLRIPSPDRGHGEGAGSCSGVVDVAQSAPHMPGLQALGADSWHFRATAHGAHGNPAC